LFYIVQFPFKPDYKKPLNPLFFNRIFTARTDAEVRDSFVKNQPLSSANAGRPRWIGDK